MDDAQLEEKVENAPAVDQEKLKKEMLKDVANASDEAAPEEVEYTIGHKEFKALKKSRYDKNSHKYKKSFVIQNKKTGMIVELKGINAYHVAKMIGWKPNQVVLIKENDISQEVPSDSSDTPDTSDK